MSVTPNTIIDLHSQCRDHLTIHLGPNMFFFTITLSPKLYQYTTPTQFAMTCLEVRHIHAKNTKRFVQTVETTANGNIHYHSICLFGDKVQRINFINALRKKRILGFIKMTDNSIIHVDNMNRSISYLLKEYYETVKLLHSPNYKPEFFFIE